MVAAEGILTSHGGKTSHAAVIARGMGTPCVCGVERFRIDAAEKVVRIEGSDRTARGRHHLHRRHPGHRR
ncbi:MAG: PEP-utilizing enzyme [Collinsella sp.]